VVAERGRVEADRVHRGRHRMDLALARRLDLREVVGELRALDGVAGVDQDRAFGAPIGADRVDERRDLRQPDVVAVPVVVLAVVVVVPVEDVAVQVGRAEHGEPRAVLR
jgi:hypothetical protein